MVNFSFKIKSNWFDKGIIRKIGAEGFWVYINLRRFWCKNFSPIETCTIITSISLLHRAVNEIHKDAGRDNHYTKDDVISILRNLRSIGIIGYDNNLYRFKNYNEAMEIKLLDLPLTIREYCFRQ